MLNSVGKIVEEGILAGTNNKYESRNPVQNYLLKQFFSSLRSLAQECVPACDSAVDIGCGEGVTTALLRGCGLSKIHGLDFSAQIIKVAKLAYPDIPFDKVNIYDLNKQHSSDFVSACEVLEHLEHPELGLEKLAQITKKYCILSVPNEPLFRCLNFCAGKYWSRFGSSPGHLNHWSSKCFIQLVGKYFTIEKVSRPLPWTIILTRPKSF